MDHLEQDLDQLVAGAPLGLGALMDSYEPIEAAYTAAVPYETVSEATSTAGLPRTAIHSSTSVR